MFILILACLIVAAAAWIISLLLARKKGNFGIFSWFFLWVMPIVGGIVYPAFNRIYEESSEMMLLFVACIVWAVIHVITAIVAFLAE